MYKQLMLSYKPNSVEALAQVLLANQDPLTKVPVLQLTGARTLVQAGLTTTPVPQIPLIIREAEEEEVATMLLLTRTTKEDTPSISPQRYATL